MICSLTASDSLPTLYENDFNGEQYQVQWSFADLSSIEDILDGQYLTALIILPSLRSCWQITTCIDALFMYAAIMLVIPCRNDLNDGRVISTMKYWLSNMFSMKDIFALGPDPR